MITFRQIERSDLPLMQKWRNSDYVRPYVREYRFLSEYDQVKWYENYILSRGRSDWAQELNIILVDYKPVGVAGYVRIQWHERRAEISYYLGDTSAENIRLKILELIISKGFNEFGFHKVTWPVYSHDPNLELYKKSMNTEAILKEENWWNGKWQDRIYLSKINGQN